MLLDDDVKFKVSPMPRLYEGNEWDIAIHGAEAFEKLIRQQLIAAHFNEFQRPFILQAAIRRFSVAKVHWREETARVKELAGQAAAPRPALEDQPRGACARSRHEDAVRRPVCRDGRRARLLLGRGGDEAREQPLVRARRVDVGRRHQALAKQGIYSQAAADRSTRIRPTSRPPPTPTTSSATARSAAARTASSRCSRFGIATR
jgi:hypothetical protein